MRYLLTKEAVTTKDIAGIRGRGEGSNRWNTGNKNFYHDFNTLFLVGLRTECSKQSTETGSRIATVRNKHGTFIVPVVCLTIFSVSAKGEK